MAACSLTCKPMKGSSKKEKGKVILHAYGEQEETLEECKSQ